MTYPRVIRSICGKYAGYAEMLVYGDGQDIYTYLFAGGEWWIKLDDNGFYEYRAVNPETPHEKLRAYIKQLGDQYSVIDVSKEKFNKY